MIAITNRVLCNKPFLDKIEDIAELNPNKIILREKDLTPLKYEELAMECKIICDRYHVELVLHTHIEIAKKLLIPSLQIPLRIMKEEELWKDSFFKSVGTSIHSVEEALEAEKLGASYVIAGHIFETDCKKGLKGRGLEFLKNLKQSVSIPIYAIGGINKENIKDVLNVGADDVCIMSGFMKNDNISLK